MKRRFREQRRSNRTRDRPRLFATAEAADADFDDLRAAFAVGDDRPREPVADRAKRGR